MPVPSVHAATPFRRLARFVAAFAWCGLIFAASDRPDLRVSSDDLLDFVLRKTAHVLVYAVLFVLFERALRGERWARRGSIPAAWLATFAYACSDEWHQTFVAGRSGQVSDVGFDMLGATLAAAVTLLIRRRSAPGSSIAAPATIPVSEPAP